MVCKLHIGTSRHWLPILSHRVDRIGPDGPWGSIFLNIGDENKNGSGQTFHAFPALSLSIVLLPMDTDFCNVTNNLQWNDKCEQRAAELNGRLANWEPKTSSTFRADGKSKILLATNLLNWSGQDLTDNDTPYGSDVVGLGRAGPKSYVSPFQTVAGLVSKTYFTALLGLSNLALNLEYDTTTVLALLQAANAIQSVSLSYTAGSYARCSLPSLVIGGYDSTRFDPSPTLQVGLRDTTDPYDTDQFNVDIAGITITADNRNLTDTVSVPLDSVLAMSVDPVTPQIWLPKTTCDLFAEAFGLEWDPASELYTVNRTTHERLVETNPPVTFSLQSSRVDGTTQNFTLSYQTSFDLNVSYPFVDSWKYYFPLKRASRPSQYMLGRAFFQEVHISIDYDGRYFNLSQARPGNGTSQLVTIEPQSNSSSSNSPSDPPLPPLPPSGLSMGAYAGIGTGIGIGVLAVVLLVISWRKRWALFKKNAEQHKAMTLHGKLELHNSAVPLVEVMGKERVELETNEQSLEVAGSTGLEEVHELDASSRDESHHARDE